MIKLYRRRGEVTEYWEAWVSKGTVTVHWGAVGEKGACREFVEHNDAKARRIIDLQAKAAVETGFAHLPPDNHDAVVVQFPIVGMGTVKDLDNRNAVIELIDNEIGWLGGGNVDGGDIGSGTMNIFIQSPDGRIIAAKIVAILEEAGLLSGAIVAWSDADLDYTVVYPQDYVGQFDPI